MGYRTMNSTSHASCRLARGATALTATLTTIAARWLTRSRFGPTFPALAQRFEQRPQPIVIELLHEREQAADVSGRKALSRKPIEVMAGQIGNESTFVFAERHGERDEAFEVGRIHKREKQAVDLSVSMEER